MPDFAVLDRSVDSVPDQLEPASQILPICEDRVTELLEVAGEVFPLAIRAEEQERVPHDATAMEAKADLLTVVEEPTGHILIIDPEVSHTVVGHEVGIPLIPAVTN